MRPLDRVYAFTPVDTLLLLDTTITAQGCHKDNATHMIPLQIIPPGSVSPNQWAAAWDCQQAAVAEGQGYDTVGLQASYSFSSKCAVHFTILYRALSRQYGGQCFAGRSSPYAVLGNASACSQGSSALGGSYTNQVMQLQPRGCTPPCSVRTVDQAATM